MLANKGSESLTQSKGDQASDRWGVSKVAFASFYDGSDVNTDAGTNLDYNSDGKDSLDSLKSDITLFSPFALFLAH